MMETTALASRLPLRRLAPLAEQARDWWAARTARERVLLTVLAAVALLALLYGLVLKPLVEMRERATREIATLESLAGRLRAQPAGAPSPPITVRSGPPSEIVSAAAAAQGLAPQVEAASGGVRLQLADAAFDAVLRLVADVEASSSLRASVVRLTRADSAGQVDAELLFRP
jgi:general secretion pathway protein M